VCLDELGGRVCQRLQEQPFHIRIEGAGRGHCRLRAVAVSGVVDAAEVACNPLAVLGGRSGQRQPVSTGGAEDERGQQSLRGDAAVLDIEGTDATELGQLPLAFGDKRLVRLLADQLVAVTEFSSVDAVADHRLDARA